MPLRSCEQLFRPGLHYSGHTSASCFLFSVLNRRIVIELARQLFFVNNLTSGGEKRCEVRNGRLVPWEYTDVMVARVYTEL